VIGPFVDIGWLRAHRDEVVLADVRWYLDGRSGRVAYQEEGHPPGAVFVDLDAALAGDASPAAGRHPLPDPERFAAGMEAAGIGDGDVVVAYDDEGGVIAARLVWMLRATGHEAALLDGGLQAWDGPLERGAARPERARARGARFTPAPWPAALLAGIDEAADPGTLVLDARPPERFRGDVEPVDARAGHIPGAVNLPAREHVGPDGRLRAAQALRERFAAAGVDGDAAVISSCGSGVTACHTLLVLEHVGLGGGRLFPGSWSQWSHDRARPVATGD
jgi:thiosulfate/3-mercaptopyruvate sulfurtransferase